MDDIKNQENIIDRIQEQAKREIKMGLDFINPKREIFRNRLEKYVDQDKEEGKIGVNTIYAMVNLWVAIRLSDEATVLFQPRQFWDEEYAENLTNLAKFDYEEMWLAEMDYARHWDTFFFGYSIRTKKGWNKIKNCPKVYQEDPLTWIPDPYGDYLNPFRFHYFEKEMLKSSLTEEYGFLPNIEVTNQTDEEIKANKTYRNEASWFNDVAQDTSDDFYVSVYDGFTYIDWELYQVTILSGTKEVIRANKIEPVRLEEKETGFIDIKTQVEVEWYSPKRGDPCGVSLPDLVIDKQIADSQLLNLRLIDAKFSTFGQTNLVNTDIVKNTSDLKNPSINTKWIWVKSGGQPLSNAIYPVPRQNIMQDSYNVSNEIRRQQQLDTGIGENTLWVAEKGLTLGQSQQVQANANIKLALGITISNWGEKDFWDYIWLRSYEEYLSSGTKKMIRVANGFWSNVLEFRRDDFLWGKNPDIIIESKKKVETEIEKMKVNFLSMAPYFIQDPTKPKIVRNFVLRYMLKLNGVPREMINVMTYDDTEEVARYKVNLINNNDMEGAVIDSPYEDHLSFLVMFESARDTPAKIEAIRRRRMALAKMSWKKNMQQEVPQGGMINATQAQATSAQIWQAANPNINLSQISSWQ